MVLKPVVPALVAAVLLAAGSVALADEYRPDEFLGLDLSRAVLSPKRLGPASEFAPVAVEAKSDVKSEAKNDRASEANWARNELKTEPKKVAVQSVHVTHPHRVTHVAAAKPEGKVKGAARTKLAHRHASPLDAQAMDTRVQKWPCKSGGGGICGWK
jgi:hypothetical protein